jgi:hypothetical protein
MPAGHVVSFKLGCYFSQPLTSIQNSVTGRSAARLLIQVNTERESGEVAEILLSASCGIYSSCVKYLGNLR